MHKLIDSIYWWRNINAHVAHQEGWPIIPNYNPTCGAFLHKLSSIVCDRKFQDIEVMRSWLGLKGLIWREFFISRNSLPSMYAICFERILKIHPSWHAWLSKLYYSSKILIWTIEDYGWLEIVLILWLIQICAYCCRASSFDWQCII